MNRYMFHNEKTENKIYPKVKELDERLERSFSGRNVLVHEKVCGKPISINVDDNKIHMFSEYRKITKNKDYYKSFKVVERYKSNLSALKKKLNGVSYTLYGELISQNIQKNICYLTDKNGTDIVFHDLFVNDNWMNRDDFKIVVDNIAKLKTPQLLYNGIFSITAIKSLLKIKSKTSEIENQNMEGVIIHPYLEDKTRDEKNIQERLIAKVTNNDHNKMQQRISSSEIAYKVMQTYFDDDQVGSYWKSALGDKRIKINKKNLEKIQEVLLKDAFDMIEDELFIETSKAFVSYTNARDAFEAQLIWKIRKILEI